MESVRHRVTWKMVRSLDADSKVTNGTIVGLWLISTKVNCYQKIEVAF